MSLGGAPEPPGSLPDATPALRAPAQIEGQFARGIAWTASLRWTAQLLTWLSTLVVARLLAPEDYGLLGMATVYTGLVYLVNEFGLGAAILILRDLDRTAVARLNSLALLLGSAWFGISWFAATPIGAFYGAPEVPAIVRTLAVAFVIGAFQTVPYALLGRELRFRALAAIDFARALSAALVTLGLALAGQSYWALVAGALAGTAVAAGLAVLSHPHPFALPRPSRAAISVSGHIVASRLAWYTQTNADLLIAGKLLGGSALGYYTFAFTLGSKPVELIATTVFAMTPSLFSALQGDREALRRYFLLITEGIAVLTLPATWGIALVADRLVPVVLGAKWSGAIAPLQVLAFYASFRCLTPLLAHALNVTGDTRYGMRVGVLSAVVLPLGFWFGSRYGTVGIAAAWLVLHPMVSLLNFRRVFRTLSIRPGGYLAAVQPALSGSLVMAVAVLATRAAVSPALSLAQALAVEVAAGALAFGLALLALHRGRVSASLRALRALRTQTAET